MSQCKQLDHIYYLLYNLTMLCNICPRGCNINRETNVGYCGINDKIEISKVMLHYGEEPFLTKDNKPSGAIFFAGCNLKCVYCQNYEISNSRGKQISIETLVSLYKQLEDAGASNIDLVTPTHFSNLIIESLKIYKPKIPVIFNCGGYESIETIKNLLNYVDVFLFDFKYFDDKYAIKYSKAPHYFETASKAIALAIKNKPNIFSDGQMTQGVVIRHLCIPTLTEDSKHVLEYIANNFGKDTYISLMSQFTPTINTNSFPEINRKLKPIEYKIVLNYAIKLGLNHVLIQDLSSSGEEMIPDFKHDNHIFKY